MELIDVIKSSLIIFFSFVSVTAAFSYISYKVKDRTRDKIGRNCSEQTENSPIQGVYPRMIPVTDSYKVPGEIKEKFTHRRLNIFRNYSFNLSEKMHKLKLSSSK
ncbi:MAG: hypothetical protein EHM47_18295 [Ignavibacteriales bacterium]|nr:MAG: hypothetical protein EHM47_18295 [Ignavibacteriales bacterium]